MPSRIRMAYGLRRYLRFFCIIVLLIISIASMEMIRGSPVLPLFLQFLSASSMLCDFGAGESGSELGGEAR